MNEKSAPPALGEREGGLGEPFQAARRALLKGIFGALGALGLGSLLYGAYRFTAPGSGKSPAVEVALGEVPPGGWVHFQYGGSPGILFRGEEGSLTAFSLVCTHLACNVTWNGEKREFFCPCHDGYFDAEGKVLSGPPPSPLERLRVEVRGDKALIGA